MYPNSWAIYFANEQAYSVIFLALITDAKTCDVRLFHVCVFKSSNDATFELTDFVPYDPGKASGGLSTVVIIEIAVGSVVVVGVLVGLGDSTGTRSHRKRDGRAPRPDDEMTA
jgi:hypothetical protein